MAFLNKVGSILKQRASKQIGSQFFASNPSIYQALRCMSSSKVFIGGLPWAVDDSSLRETFSQYGEVLDARVIVDREQNRSKGFGFVTYSSTEAASSAIQAMDGQNLQGRNIKVDYAADRPPRAYGGGGYSGGGYGGGNNGNYAGGYGNGGASHGVAAGVGDAADGNGFASSGFEGGSGFGSSGDQFGIGSTSPVSNDAGDFNPTGVPESSFGDDVPDDDAFAKRA